MFFDFLIRPSAFGPMVPAPLQGRSNRRVFRANAGNTGGGPGRGEMPDEPPSTGEGSRLPRTPHVKGLSLWRILTAIGGLVMIISFFTPWWRMSIDVRSPGQQDVARRTLEQELSEYRLVRMDHAEFHNRRFGGGQLNRFERPLDQQGGSHALRAWGWDFGRGIATLILGLVVLAVAMVVMFVPIMRYYAWTAMLPAALFGLIVVILSLTVWIGSPGEDVVGSYIRFWQGVHVGPFLALAGGLLALVGGVLDGLINLIWHSRRTKRRVVA
ncbi:MAG: hypothetical protein GXY38_02300 [Planctomycetes bacterium]|jgi:hypothetical protein|nr:hypothetical protein [Planctomycetota bacterium]